ncbi:hypothetical protein CYMTET_5191 [Cymbomonas tetramitiformis]|uniref:Uncharacterized protein n=1 Tax=Cymbomonas tetramitiformis TaxID=36881 RepID=A0AAE0LJC2_9CHLO|nr:hypothetical protein CYMTET_5191 [Cymbomonas tetramitiformis]
MLEQELTLGTGSHESSQSGILDAAAAGCFPPTLISTDSANLLEECDDLVDDDYDDPDLYGHGDHEDHDYGGASEDDYDDFDYESGGAEGDSYEGYSSRDS